MDEYIPHAEVLQVLDFGAVDLGSALETPPIPQHIEEDLTLSIVEPRIATCGEIDLGEYFYLRVP